MTKAINPKLIRFVKGIIDVLYFGLIIASIFLLLWIAISPLIIRYSNVTITASVPVAIGEGAEPRFEVDVAESIAEGIRSAFVDEAQGTLRLETTNWYFIFVSNLAKLLTAIGLAYVFFLLRKVIRAIMQGELFTAENAAMIRRIGYFILLVSLLSATAEYIAANEILNQFADIQPSLSLPSPFEAEIILASLLILVLAQVWSYGLDLERDQALTI